MDKLNFLFEALVRAAENGSGREHRLRIWSNFIRERDGNRCVICHSRKKLSAHHIIRKSFWKYIQFQTGNGITLCRACHKEPHQGFNRRPDLSQPMDAEGGEKIDLFTGYLGALVIDSEIRGLLQDKYYYFDDHALSVFRDLQGIPIAASFDGRRIEQAYQIWNQTPRSMLESILGSMGVSIPNDYVQDGMISIYKSDQYKKEDGTPGDVVYFRYIPPTEFKVDPFSNEVPPEDD